MAHNRRKENPIIRGSDAYSLLLEMDSAIHENGASEGCLIRNFFITAAEHFAVQLEVLLSQLYEQ